MLLRSEHALLLIDDCADASCILTSFPWRDGFSFLLLLAVARI